ncbi:MAG TPA: BadF/BadG/BcrA/BcrD ATPase family protein [Candidatus Acidoferrales bacterium]|nr:BadF/BadG/BcrA/BcrD ATPase family protein [Candidatus Acidoferrales bacterium]
MHRERVVVGVDGGGSTTAAACRRDGERFDFILQRTANPIVCGVEAAVAAIGEAIEATLDGATPVTIAAGIAGAARPEIAAGVCGGIERRFPGARVIVVDDARVALRSAVAGGDGIALVAGTGSIAYAEIGEARYRAGGYGYAIGDDGSGYAIGAAAVRLLARAFDGRATRDAMTDDVAAQLGARDGLQLIAAVYQEVSPVTTVASVAPVVLRRAGLGERSAVKIVQSAANDLFELLRGVWRAAHVGERELPLALCGGLLRENSMLTFLLETRVGNELPFLRARKGCNPVDGALAIAERTAAVA